MSINPEADITVYNCFVIKENVMSIIEGHRIAINALDFDTDIPLLFDKIYKEKGITVFTSL